MFSTLDLAGDPGVLVLADELQGQPAAIRLPSRVSKIIRTPEAHVGGKLLERTNRRLTPIAQSERLVTIVKPAYEQFWRAFDDTHAANTTGIARAPRMGSSIEENPGPHRVAPR
jgi:hypothetical protein